MDGEGGGLQAFSVLDVNLLPPTVQLGTVPTTNNFGKFLRRLASGVRYVLFCWCKSMLSLGLQGTFRAILAQMFLLFIGYFKHTRINSRG